MKSILVITLTVIFVGCTSAGGFKIFLKLYDPPGNACSYDPLILKTKTVTVDGPNCGKDFNAQDFSEVTQVLWKTADEYRKYTFVFGDYEGEMIWGVSNIPGSTLTGHGKITIHKQEKVYQPPKDPKTQVTYKALIYLQKDWILKNNVEEKNLKLKTFVQKSNLLGPLAGVEVRIKPLPPS